MEVGADKEEAKAVLLRALEALERAEEDFGEARRTYLVVVWAHQVEGRTVRGWEATDEPSFVTSALLRGVAKRLDCLEDDDEEDDDE